MRAVMENLGPEKIDIVDWSADPAKFVAAALSPAVATGVQVISEKNKTAIAFIHDDQLSLAIGKEGQNARLAAKLTGWKIGIESAEAHAKKMAESADHSDGGNRGNKQHFRVDNKPVDVQSTGLSMLDSTIQSVTAMPSCPGKRRGITNMVAR